MSLVARIKSARLLSGLALPLTTIALAAPIAANASEPASGEPTPAASAASGLRPGWSTENKRAKKRKKARPGVARASWVYDGYSGRPGAVTDATAISALDVNYGYGPMLMVMNSSGPTVSRSSATTGAQDAQILYSLQVWNGNQWVQQTQQIRHARIPAGYSGVRLPSLTVYPTAYRGYTRVVEGIAWFVAGTNTLLGITVIRPHVASDQVCVTRSRPCVSYPGYMRVGSVMGGW